MNAPDAAPAPQTRCANCAQPLPLPLPNYCAHCGQESRLRPPTLMEFLQQFGGAYLSTEGALWRSLARLLVPGQLTLEYLAGRRRRYVLPLRLYLTVSVVAFLILKLAGGLELRGQEGKALRIDPGEQLRFIELGHWRAGLEQGRFYCENLPAPMCERLRRRLHAEPAALAAEVRDGKDRFIGHWATAMFLLLPLFALWLKLLWLDTGRRYTEHLVFALHLHAFWFAALLLCLPPLPWLRALTAGACLLYPLVALQRVYARRWWSTLLRAGLLLLLNLFTIGFALAAVLILTLLT